MAEMVKKATRESFGEALAQLAGTVSRCRGAGRGPGGGHQDRHLQERHIPDRFIDCGIAECNMIGIAAGLATCGKIPFAASFAMFCRRPRL